MESLGLSKEQQANIDTVFLDATMSSVPQKNGLASDTADELELIKARTFEGAHDAIIAEREISPAIIQNLGKISFLDSLALSTGEYKKVQPSGRIAVTFRRRLFKDWDPDIENIQPRRRLYVETGRAEKSSHTIEDWQKKKLKK